jgi:hypothetical protein
MFKNVIVGVDEHEGGRDAIALAKHLVEKGGQLTLTHVHHGYAMSVPSPNPDYRAEEHERALELLTRAREESGVEAAVRPIGSQSVGPRLSAPTCSSWARLGAAPSAGLWSETRPATRSSVRRAPSRPRPPDIRSIRP